MLWKRMAFEMGKKGNKVLTLLLFKIRHVGHFSLGRESNGNSISTTDSREASDIYWMRTLTN